MVFSRGHGLKPIAFATGIFVCLFLFMVGFSSAEETSAVKIEELDTVEKVQEKIHQINDRLKIVSTVNANRVPLEFGVSTEEFEQRLLGLRMLKSAHQRLLYSISALKKIEKESLTVQDQYEKYQAKGMVKEPPYALTFLDAIHEERSNVERNQQNIDSTLEVINREIAADNDRLQTIEKELRRLNETLSDADENDQKNKVAD